MHTSPWEAEIEQISLVNWGQLGLGTEGISLGREQAGRTILEETI